MNFMKKIPPGAEASNVLVGEVDFLEKPIIAFVRLSPAVLITGLTEVPVPTRYYDKIEFNNIMIKTLIPKKKDMQKKWLMYYTLSPINS